MHASAKDPCRSASRLLTADKNLPVACRLSTGKMAKYGVTTDNMKGSIVCLPYYHSLCKEIIMHTFILCSTVCLSVLLANVASADTYKCPGTDGAMISSKTPCEESKKGTSPSPSASPSKAVPKQMQALSPSPQEGKRLSLWATRQYTFPNVPGVSMEDVRLDSSPANVQRLVGTVRNAGATPITRLTVRVRWLAQEQEIDTIEFSLLRFETVEPGQTHSWQQLLPSPNMRPDDYEVTLVK